MAKDYMTDWDAVVAEAKLLGQHSKESYTAFGGVHKAAFRDGALDRKTKELLALGMGIAQHCEGCILSHTRSALRAGATLEEIAEVVDVAILMGGGPGSVYGGKALAAAQQFQEKLAK